MEDRADSPIAVKVEGNSRSVVLTYFQGDTNSMVDAHFDRALSKTSRTEGPAGRPRKVLKAVKSGKHSLTPPPEPESREARRGKRASPQPNQESSPPAAPGAYEPGPPKGDPLRTPGSHPPSPRLVQGGARQGPAAPAQEGEPRGKKRAHKGCCKYGPTRLGHSWKFGGAQRSGAGTRTHPPGTRTPPAQM
uniref:Uncharacterized protein n=2 Tax=Oryzias latipes TaxID=8090 RepID=H2L8L5_ORYLA